MRRRLRCRLRGLLVAQRARTGLAVSLSPSLPSPPPPKKRFSLLPCWNSTISWPRAATHVRCWRSRGGSTSLSLIRCRVRV